jgi:hypothetical protein
LVRSPQSHPHGHRDTRIGFALQLMGGRKHDVFVSLLRGSGPRKRYHVAGALRGRSLTLVRPAKGIGSGADGVWIGSGSESKLPRTPIEQSRPAASRRGWQPTISIRNFCIPRMSSAYARPPGRYSFCRWAKCCQNRNDRSFRQW